ncbi:MAG: hypothetical protein KDA77_23325, partial [Planctomycetaceae bacterium]|nr:hypothetical protein [Planctomycetaceae bacterium]
ESRQKMVLIVGNDHTCEMQPVRDAVPEICSGAQTVRCASLEGIPGEARFPDLILLCQNWPDEFDPHTLNDLVSRFPVSRFICCYGVWSEADGRTRSNLPLSIRVPARCVITRLQLEWEIIRGDREAFPLTSGRDEMFLIEASHHSLQLAVQGEAPLIRVVSGDRAYQIMLEEMIVSWGGRISQDMCDKGTNLVIMDLDPWERVVHELETQTTVTAPMIGVMGLAHPETIAVAKRWGIETLICKVAPEQELFQAVKRSLQVKAIPQAECLPSGP